MHVSEIRRSIPPLKMVPSGGVDRPPSTIVPLARISHTGQGPWTWDQHSGFDRILGPVLPRAMKRRQLLAAGAGE
jgi:hypothetical protein